jgi:hypothetical protein
MPANCLSSRILSTLKKWSFRPPTPSHLKSLKGSSLSMNLDPWQPAVSPVIKPSTGYNPLCNR